MALNCRELARRRIAAAVLVGCTLAFALLLRAPFAIGQDESRSLIEQDPFDQITLDEANGSEVIRIAPISFPGGKPPEKPRSTDKLVVKLLETGREYEVAWRHIARYDQFQDLLLAELKKLSTEGKFDQAYDYLLHLRSNYPKTSGLDEAHHLYLYQSAGGAFRQGKYAEALGLLEELHSRAPKYQLTADGPALTQVLGSAADRLVGAYVAKGDYRSARTLLDRLTKKYSAAALPFTAKWRDQLASEAAVQRDAARAALAEENYIAAYDAFSRMQEIWPQVEGGDELAAEMAEKYPLVRVGVLATAKRHDERSLVDPAARRTGRLVELPLFEYQSAGPEGGVYRCPFGETEISEDGRQLTFRLHPSASSGESGKNSSGRPALDGYQLSQFLLPKPSPSSGTDALARLIESVAVENVWQVAVDFRRPHVLPQAVLQDALGRAGESSEASGRFRQLSSSDGVTRFVSAAEERPRGQIAEIVERTFEDPQRAILALKRGEIDVLERVYPADVAELRQDRSIVVERLGLPTTHIIVVRRHNPYLANRTFRRALLYGSDRETILRGALLKGSSLPGYRVISAPFPAPAEAGDVVAYGYDQRIAPRPYDARLALTLRLLGQREVKAVFDQRTEKLPPLERLTLAHPADESARIACRALAAQWKAIGVLVDLVELPPGEVLDENAKYDLLYVEACLPEPLVDAGRLLGLDGLAPAESNFIQLCLRQIDSATNWQQARQHFQQLHRLLSEDVTVIPLWQTYDHFAYRRGVQGIGRQPVSLYQNIEQWRLSPQTVGN